MIAYKLFSSYLKAVAFAEAQFSVCLGLECIKRHLQKNQISKVESAMGNDNPRRKFEFHHHVKDVLCHAVGMRVVDFLLCVIRWEPADLRFKEYARIGFVAGTLLPYFFFLIYI